MNSYKNFTLFYLVLIILSSFKENVNAQWQQLKNYEGGSSVAIERKGNKIWLGTLNGLFYSTDEGANWEACPEIKRKIIKHISYVGDTLIVLYSTNQIFGYSLYSRTSFDDGVTWNAEAKLPQLIYPLSRKTVIEKIKGKLYILYGLGQNYVSDDDGQNWELFSPIGTDEDYHEVIGHTKEGFIFKYYSQPPLFNCLFYNPANEETKPINIHFAPQNVFTHDNNIFAISRGNNKSTIFRSNNLGETWDTLYTTDLPISTNNEPFIDGSDIYLKSFFGYEVSYDNGNSWQHVSKVPIFVDFTDFVRTTSAEYLSIDHFKNVLRYTPDLNNYSPSGSGINNKGVKKIFQNRGRLFTINLGENLMSTDGGQTWTNILEGHNFIEDGCFKGDTIIFLEKNNDPALMISYNNGDTWLIRNVHIDLGHSNYVSVAMINETLYLNTRDFFLESKDMGIVWKEMTSLPSYSSQDCLQNSDRSGLLEVIDGTLFAVSNSGYVFQYDTQTSLWKYIMCNWSQGAFQDNRIFNVGSTYCVLINDLFVSDDGVNFTKSLGLGIPTSNYGNPSHLISITEVDDTWYAAFEDSGIYYSKNKGDQWLPLDALPPFIPKDGGIINFSGKLIAGTSYAGLWERSLFSNKSSGYVYYDIEGNGINDGEDYPLSSFKLKLSNSGSYITTDLNGNFEIPVDNLIDTLKAISSNSFFQSTPAHYVVNGGEDDLIFGIHLPENVKNVSSDLTSTTKFYPGSVAVLEATAGNLSSTKTSVLLKIILDPATSLISAEPSNYSLNGNTVVWNSELLNFGQTSVIKLNLNISPNAADGDSLIFQSIAYELMDDIEPQNNYSQIRSIVENNFPENEKLCLQGERINTEEIINKKEIQYVINFQNNNNDTVKNVRINDLLDLNLDPSSFRLISQSHPVRPVMSEKGVLDFYFDDINLESSSTSDSKSRGYVKYGILAKTDYVINNSIKNTALIYFDENQYISTNTVTTYIVEPPLSNNRFNKTGLQKILVYPNPTNHGISLDFTNLSSNRYEVKIVNMMGNKIRSVQVNKSQNYIDLPGLNPGMYIGLIMDDQGQNIGNFKFIFN